MPLSLTERHYIIQQVLKRFIKNQIFLNQKT